MCCIGLIREISVTSDLSLLVDIWMQVYANEVQTIGNEEEGF